MRRALTLVELLASLVIVTLLMVTALSVTTAVARSRLVLESDDGRREALDRGARALLAADLVHAHHWRPTENGFAVQTLVRLSGRAMRLEHVPSTVTYQVVATDGPPCLVRVQQAPPEAPRRELVAVGAREVVLEPGAETRPNRYGWRPLGGGCTAALTVGGADGRTERIAARVPGPDEGSPTK